MEWTSDQIYECYLAEVRMRFEAENASYLELERLELARMPADDVAKLPEHMRAPKDSLFHEIYKATTIARENVNAVVITLPECGWAIGSDLLRMFENTEVAWTYLHLKAVPYWDDEGRPAARLVVEVMLVDYHDDERSHVWRARHRPVPKFCDWGRFDARESRLQLAAVRLSRASTKLHPQLLALFKMD